MIRSFAFFLLVLAIGFPLLGWANQNLPSSVFQVPSHDCLHKPLKGTLKQKQEFRYCLDGVSQLFSISPSVLVTIKRTESGLHLDPKVTGYNTNGTTDISLMQVNYEVWSKELKKLGINLPKAKYYETCNNLLLSGWILRKHLDRFGGDAFEAVGRYHSGTPSIKKIYQEKFVKQARQVIAACPH